MLRWRNIQRFFQRQKLSLVRTVASASDAISPMQLTLAIVKPHAVSQPFVVQGIDEAILKEGFYVVRNKEIYLSKDEASQFYAEHKGRFFYQRAVEMMASGPIIVKILARINAISHWRTLMGPTKVSRRVQLCPFHLCTTTARYFIRTKLTHPDSLRGRFGLTDTRNAVHGSDSDTSTARECNFFLPEFNVKEWYENDEPVYRSGNVKYDETIGVHVRIL
ncbi:nucleoside diphosphate kinase 6-like isoform X1 [Paramacrobiotus metropolitanus]|uniref:nucleoside diphosphate kinase 6-like isoform X1 n=1 Tax=Paramacrobiotus metropolitanus TaxID=2943436 RepID=UPI0024461EDC|nr:nucleoside diphosphate kinase 6-like isoform X1 [Paramacrobiotus metropolitanus]